LSAAELIRTPITTDHSRPASLAPARRRTPAQPRRCDTVVVGCTTLWHRSGSGAGGPGGTARRCGFSAGRGHRLGVRQALVDLGRGDPLVRGRSGGTRRGRRPRSVVSWQRHRGGATRHCRPVIGFSVPLHQFRQHRVELAEKRVPDR
jgi:hypothetical protein